MILKRSVRPETLKIATARATVLGFEAAASLELSALVDVTTLELVV
jgi:hypothetical protein